MSLLDATTMNTLFADHLLLEDGWSDNVRLHWNDEGDLTQIELNSQRLPHERSEKLVIPGMINLHSHAFQRAMVGMTEIAHDDKDNFWTWRELMYRFALTIDPDQMQAIAAQFYSECLR